MVPPNEALIPQVSDPFLRSLEADLRGLCADARKRNPNVKEEAERVILCLKEADTQQSKADAADKAAAVFCSACEASDLTAGSSSLSTHVKVALRAVSSLHKLLIHRAVYPSRLAEVLSALERLSDPCVDDNITLKVLQGILSVLTIRGYAKSLSEDELLQAFSLLFTVKTSRSLSAGNAASTTFSAVSVGSSAHDVGVIEQTAKAAFRQVTSDLFASAADAAVQTAVERKAPSGEFIAVALFPVEVRAAFSLFIDLINAASGEALEWIPSSVSPSRGTSALLDVPLAIEVLDDNLASNIVLFAGQPVFSEILSARLCPVIHRLLKTVTEKPTLRTLLSLVVSLIRHYWRTLQPDTEALLHSLSRMSLEVSFEERTDRGWAPVYAIEALRCIFRREANETSRVVDLVKAFDLRDGSGSCVGEAVHAASHLMNRWKAGMIERVPPGTFIGESKPFLNTIKPTDAFCAAVATSIYAEVIDSAWETVNAKDVAVARVLVRPGTLELSIRAIERIAEDIFSQGLRPQEGRKIHSTATYNALVTCLARIAKICDAGSLESEKDLVLGTLSTICCKCVAGDFFDSVRQQRYQLEAADVAFNALLDVTIHCKESLGRSWLPILRAIERLDSYTCSREKVLKAEPLQASTALDVLTAKMQSVLSLPTSLSWKACHDMIAAFVQCSRQSVAQISKNEDTEDVAAGRIDPGLEIFGMKSAESAFNTAIHRNPAYQGPEPSSLWQLLSSHLTSVCLDSSQYSLRVLALKTLTGLICGTVSSSEGMIPQNLVVAPLLDLLASHNADVCTGCVNSVYVLLTTQGERLSDAAAWLTVLQLLSLAGGCRLPIFSSDDYKRGFQNQEVVNGTLQGAEMVSEGFKVVQVIASDFLASLSYQSLLSWVALLRVYCLQNADVNVALTAVGLLWRTADFLAKSSLAVSAEPIWIALVVALKDISLDERPEVRKCAIKTLMGALSAHASKMSPDAWDSCLEFALIPLLDNVLRGGATSSVEEPVAGKNSSEVPLLLHHSRDTPRKQWNETRVLALSGVAEVLRVALPYMIRNRDGDSTMSNGTSNDMMASCWNDLLKATCVAACSRDTEVAVAGVSAILDYLHSVGRSCSDCIPDFSDWHAPERSIVAGHRSFRGTVQNNDSAENGTDPRYKGVHEEVSTEQLRNDFFPGVGVERLWNSIWSTLDELLDGEGPHESERPDVGKQERALSLVNQRAVMLLSEGLLTSWRDLRKKFSASSSEILAAILIKLSFASSRRLRLEIESPEDLALLEEVAVVGLENLATTGNAACRYSIICELLRTLSSLRESREMPLQKQATRAIRMVKLVFEQEETPMDMRLNLIPRVIEALRPFILSCEPHRKPSTESVLPADNSAITGNGESPSWIAALDVLISVMGSVPAVHFSGTYASLWIPYLMVVEEFVYLGGSRGKECGVITDDKSVNLSRKREMYAILLTGNAMKVLTRVSSDSSNEAKRFLLRLLTRGAEEGVTSGRPRFVHACQKILFATADEDESSDASTFSVSSEAAEFIVRMCDRALRMFVADDQRAGRCPLPARRREEIVFLLSQLILLNRKASASRNHVVDLYPRLCECVESRDEALRSLARELLDEAAPSPNKAKQLRDVQKVNVEVK